MSLSMSDRTSLVLAQQLLLKRIHARKPEFLIRTWRAWPTGELRSAFADYQRLLRLIRYAHGKVALIDISSSLCPVGLR